MSFHADTTVTERKKAWHVHDSAFVRFKDIWNMTLCLWSHAKFENVDNIVVVTL